MKLTATQKLEKAYFEFLEEKHYSKLSVSEIIERAGVSRTTCTAKGMETRTCACGKQETRDVAATGHPDADGNKICDVCGHDRNEYEEEDNSFFGKIKAFFQRIIDWFRNLFK